VTVILVVLFLVGFFAVVYWLFKKQASIERRPNDLLRADDAERQVYNPKAISRAPWDFLDTGGMPSWMRGGGADPSWPGASAPNVLPPAGWYPDPSQNGRQRYWDGTAWTEQVTWPG
jgi:hypothetical protein